MKLTQLDFHKTLTNLFLIFLLCLNRRQESLLCKRLRFSIPPQKIEYAELLYRDATMFEIKSENRDFLK